MQDLTGASERRTTVTLALLIVAAMLLPVGVAAQEAPVAPSAEPTAQPTEDPTPTEEPTATPTDDLGVRDAEIPGLPADPSEAPSDSPAEESSEEPAPVQAEGGDAEEVAAPPVAPQPEPRPTAEEVAAAGDTPSEEVVAEGAPAEGAPAGEDPADPAAAGLVPPPADAYGPQIVPSLGTATSPLTNEFTGFDGTAPLVLAPQIAGQQIAGQQVLPNGRVGVAAAPAAVGGLLAPVQDVAAASLSIVQPSWYATAFALLIMLAAAGYAAVLRGRGEVVPEAIAFAGAIRPLDGDRLTGRSVRPADLTTPTGARSVRP